MDLPREARTRVATGVAAYVRATSKNELPASLRGLERLVSTQKGEKTHAAKLVGALADDALRKRILEWLDEFKPPLKRDVLEALRLACEQPEGWRDRLTAQAAPAPVKDASGERVASLQKRLESEREAAKRARDEAKRARDDARAEVERAARAAAEARAALADEREKARELKRSLDAADAEAKRTAKTLARLERKVDRLRDAHAEEKAKLEARIKDLNRQRRELEQAVQKAQARKTKASRSARAEAGAPRGQRHVLKPPGGLTDDSVEALEAWLREGAAEVVVDGYNVTKHPDGFPELSLEEQRTRLTNGLMGLVPRFKPRWLLVWDGGEVPPGRQKKKPHPKLKIEFSPPAATDADTDRADRHIVDRVRSMPPHPVVVVTNDRGLRDALGPLRVTYARAEQLLALLR